MTRELYAGLFIVLIVLWPIFLWEFPLVLVAMAILNTMAFALVWNFSSQPKCSFWKGLTSICGCQMSGCANITLVYIFPVLTYVYFRALFFSLLALAKGKEYSRQKWLEGVIGFLKYASRNDVEIGSLAIGRDGGFTCPRCGAELVLEESERLRRQFDCPVCQTKFRIDN